MHETEDAVQEFMKAMSEARQQWDRFPCLNICEMLRPIQKRPFDFAYHSVQVWDEGQCVAEGKGNFGLTARVYDGVMQVTLQDPRLANLVLSEFGFGQISENGDRIMWTKDIYNETGEVTPHDPAMMSLFYKGGHIARIYLHVDAPSILIELQGTSNTASLKRDVHRSRESTLGEKYVGILSYFDRHPFGTEMPVLTMLSTLPPRDRCSILEVVLAKDPSNVEVYNKLSMAYLKNDEISKARELLQEGLETGAMDEFTFQQLNEKITFLHVNMQMMPEKATALRDVSASAPRSSQSYAETIGTLSGRYADNASGPFREFYQILMSLCRQHETR